MLNISIIVSLKKIVSIKREAFLKRNHLTKTIEKYDLTKKKWKRL
jgi:hypothetical protein